MLFSNTGVSYSNKINFGEHGTPIFLITYYDTALNNHTFKKSII